MLLCDGRDQLHMVIVTENMIAYKALTRRLFAENQAVASLRSLIALDRVKTTGAEIVIPGQLWPGQLWP